MARTYAEEMSCDICGTKERVESFTIVSKDGAVVIDLCIGDAKPLLNIYKQGSTEPRKRVSGDKSRSTGHAVIPVD